MESRRTAESWPDAVPQIRYLDGLTSATPLPVRTAEAARLRIVDPAVPSIRTSEILTALSIALDLTEGQLPGHALRTCYLAMRLADRVQLTGSEREALFHAAFLKDAGCSSNAAMISQIFGGDDIDIKRRQQASDRSLLAMAAFSIRSMSEQEPLPLKVRRLVNLAIHGRRARHLAEQTRCERGAGIAQAAGFDSPVADAIMALHEHWDGGGHHRGLRGEAIPLFSRMLGLCQAFDLFVSVRGEVAALDVIKSRRGSWYQPELVDALVGLCEAGLVKDLSAPDLVTRTLELEPADLVRRSDEVDVDRIAGAFADIVDAKSPFTARHSRGVAGYAAAIATELGLPASSVRDVRRAGLLHDIGKLGVSNLILDKPGRLTADEMDQIRRHPELTLRILAPVSIFQDVAELAAAHHERLDGLGYFRGLTAATIGIGARVVAVADVYEALTADRPYRAAMPADQALTILAAESGAHLASDVVAALRNVL